MIWLTAAWSAASGVAKSVPAWLWVVLLAIVLLVGAGYEMYRLGGDGQRATDIQNSVQNLRDRKTIDDEIHSLTPAGVCRKLGGVFSNDGKCL